MKVKHTLYYTCVCVMIYPYFLHIFDLRHENPLDGQMYHRGANKRLWRKIMGVLNLFLADEGYLT